MGFRPRPKVYRLTFEDPELAGLVVRATSVPIGAFLHLQTLIEISGGKDDVADPGVSGGLAAMGELAGEFVEALIEWNMEDDEGNPVPCTRDGVLSIDLDLFLEIVMQWMTAVAGVPDPLDAGSTSGGMSPEELIPMEVSSPSPTS